ncbi:MAG TPA: type II secretion system protein GspM [Gemmatimonadales bacterium]|jgi:type II secretory pathway component PulM|nr:type II secretion system protein GspM [Gemmatimonadales bacterium]
MRTLRSLSDTLGRLKPRERRVVLGGAFISATVLLVVFVGLPLAHRWAQREATYDASREQWQRLTTLAANGDRLQRALQHETVRLTRADGRLLTGATPALAASALQGLLQRYADESAVQLNRVDVASQARADQPGPGLLAVPAQLQAQGDIYGLVDFLYRLEHGEKLLPVDELSVTTGYGVGFGIGGGVSKAPQVLAWSLRLHGLYRAEAGGT